MPLASALIGPATMMHCAVPQSPRDSLDAKHNKTIRNAWNFFMVRLLSLLSAFVSKPLTESIVSFECGIWGELWLRSQRRTWDSYWPSSQLVPETWSPAPKHRFFNQTCLFKAGVSVESWYPIHHSKNDRWRNKKSTYRIWPFVDPDISLDVLTNDCRVRNVWSTRSKFDWCLILLQSMLLCFMTPTDSIAWLFCGRFWHPCASWLVSFKEDTCTAIKSQALFGRWRVKLQDVAGGLW